MATRVRKPEPQKPTEPTAEPAATTRRRATQSRTVATRRAASSSRSQRILVGPDLVAPTPDVPAETVPNASDSAAPLVGTDTAASAEVSPTPKDAALAVPVVPSSALESSPKIADAALPFAVENTPHGVVSATANDLLGVRLAELHVRLGEGQERSLAELGKMQTQMVRNLSGLSHDVDRLMKHVEGLSARLSQTETLLSRVESTLGPLSRGVSSLVLPGRASEKAVSVEVLEKNLSAALAPILAELVELRSQRGRDSSLAQVEQQILLTELRRLRSVGLNQNERNVDPLMSVGKITRRTPSR